MPYDIKSAKRWAKDVAKDAGKLAKTAVKPLQPLANKLVADGGTRRIAAAGARKQTKMIENWVDKKMGTRAASPMNATEKDFRVAAEKESQRNKIGYQGGFGGFMRPNRSKKVK